MATNDSDPNYKCAQIVKNVMKVCNDENKCGEISLPVTKPQMRAALYTGLSENTCRKFAKMCVTKLKPPRKVRADKVQLDSFDKDLIRRTVFDMIQRSKEVPTAKSIRKQLLSVMHFPYSLSFLRKTLKDLGFIWKKCGSTRTVLMERSDVAVARLRYLRKMKKFREEDRPIIFTDETYVHTTHCVKKCWQTNDVDVKVPFTRGERLIVVHAGSKDGFVKGACLIFKSKSTTGDYHNEMNSTNFFKWLKEMLIPNLPHRSVVVVDNAPYHGIQIDKCPTQASRKQVIIEWMDRNGILHEPGMLKSELLDICKRKKPDPRYVLDETLKEHGHDCLRLPQYHPELNTIELIWSQVKGKVARTNMTYKMADVQQLTRNAIESITADDWAGCCRHVQGIEQQFWKDNVAIERAVDSFLVQVSDEDATDTASEDDDYSDTDSAFEFM